jgi:NTP pyrophosphatase (non-canonical NTP hydrolase)
MINEQQKEVMSILQEECAEVIQAVSKIFRFGIDMEYDGQTNRGRLTEELGDLVAMVRLLLDKGVISMDELEVAADNKIEKLKKWSNLYDND